MMKCDKCGKHVPSNNDAAIFAAYAANDPTIMLFGSPRHLLPIIEDGKVVCEGSPSRAQYLEGQPHDPRPEYKYRPEHEARFRAAYEQMVAAARSAA